MRYKALGVVSTIYRIIGFGFLVLAPIAAAVEGWLSTKTYTIDANYNIQYHDVSVNLVLVIAVLVGGLLAGVSFYAVGQFISLMMDVEANTRQAGEALAKLARGRSAQ